MQLALNNLAARRKRFLNLAFLLVLLISQRNITVPRPVRSCRRLQRNTGWWENVCNTYSDARFKKTFRVSRDTFNFILNRIAPFLIRQTVTEEPISPALRLAICLYRLGRGDYLYTISEMSGLGVSIMESSIRRNSFFILFSVKRGNPLLYFFLHPSAHDSNAIYNDTTSLFSCE